MGIEHRWDVRIPTDVAVVLHHPTLGSVPGEISNVSDGGACINTGSTRLPRNARFEVVATLSEDGAIRIMRLPVLVIWSITGAAGVMYCHLDEAGIEARNALLVHARAMVSRVFPPARIAAGQGAA